MPLTVFAICLFSFPLVDFNPKSELFYPIILMKWSYRNRPHDIVIIISPTEFCSLINEFWLTDWRLTCLPTRYYRKLDKLNVFDVPDDHCRFHPVIREGNRNIAWLSCEGCYVTLLVLNVCYRIQMIESFGSKITK